MRLTGRRNPRTHQLTAPLHVVLRRRLDSNLSKNHYYYYYWLSAVTEVGGSGARGEGWGKGARVGVCVCRGGGGC